ncbi:MAG TPA: ABC transporter C-terminal domain-containing protein [Pyrinomonadaceae bacterium]|nr:ABC transporter C-terminal domain-containing protein [Pyrinomonadaceae bacterium]
MKLHTFTLFVLPLIMFISTVAMGQEGKPGATPVKITVTDVWLDGSRHAPPAEPNASPVPDFMAADAGLRDRIWVEVERLSEAAQKDKLNPRDLVLYLNGQELKGTKGVAVDGPKQNWLGFDLLRTQESDPIWRSLLGSPTSAYRRVNVGVGFPDKQAIPTTPGKLPFIYLRLYYGRWVVICLIVFVFIVLAFALSARRGNFIHDSDPPSPPEGKKKPYSLALTQVAWWFFIVFGSFVFIYFITGDYNTMSDQALILIGIGTGTALGAFMVNDMKRNTADAQLGALQPEKAKLEAEIAQLTRPDANADAVVLAEKQAKLAELNKQIDDAEAGLSKPVSEGFTNDLLTDVNGLAMHRFQMVIWTAVLGVIFLLGVYRNLAMPEFSGTLLALMGISAGTYLGFKIPERQTDARDNDKP